MAIARTPDEKKTKKIQFSLHIVTHLCQFMAQNSEIWGVKKMSKNCHLMAQRMANPSHIQKSTSRYVEHSMLHLWTDS